MKDPGRSGEPRVVTGRYFVLGQVILYPVSADHDQVSRLAEALNG